MFKGIFLTQDGKATRAVLSDLDESQLPAGEVDVRIEYSTLNYKDALAITGRGAIVRSWPMVPGIDLAGVVESSRDPAWRTGDAVVVTGWGLGETRWGGLAQKARLESRTLLRLPAGVSSRRAMGVATAGVTAALCVMALQHHGIKPADGPVIVTGAAGGVGSVAVALLAGLGYEVTASTGRVGESEYLSRLGARHIVDRREFESPGKPLQSERWAGAVDTVGSHTLANLCAASRWNGAVAACGLAQGPDLPTTVMPFILRGVTLYGINSVMVDNAKRQQAWDLLARHVNDSQFADMEQVIGLSSAIEFAPGLLAGKVRGRTIVDVNA